MSKREILTQYINTYPPRDPDRHQDDLELDAGRYLLIERNVGGDKPAHWFSIHYSPEDAAEYHDGQEYAEDWEIEVLVDLETGEELEATTAFVTAFTGASDTGERDTYPALLEAPDAYTLRFEGFDTGQTAVQLNGHDLVTISIDEEAGRVRVTIHDAAGRGKAGASVPLEGFEK